MVTISKRDMLVDKEKNRLIKLFKDIPEGKKKVVEGLIVQAARLRISLDELWQDLTENGDYEEFTQSEKTPSYERERPAAKLYNARDLAYQRIIKQLSDLLPEGLPKPNDGPSVDGSDLL